MFYAKAADPAILGDSQAATWTFELSTERDSDEESEVPGGIDFEEVSWNWWMPPEMDDAIADDDSTDGEPENDEDDKDDDVEPKRRAKTGGTARPAVAAAPIEDRRIFFNEVSDSLLRVINSETKVENENIILEVNSSKFAYNISPDDLNKLVMRSILEIPELRAKERRKEFASPREVFAEVQEVLATLKAVLQNYNRNMASQLNLLYAVEDCAVNYIDLPRHQPYGAYLHECVAKIIKFLYDEDVLLEVSHRPLFLEP